MNRPPTTSPLDLSPPLRIDSHLHLWHFEQKQLPWLDAKCTPIHRDFLIGDMTAVLNTANVEAAILVQARQSLEETRWLLLCASETPQACGVVGWAPLCAPDLSSVLDEFLNEPKLVGLREIVQAEPDGYLDRTDFNRGISLLTERNLSYDLLLHQGQLEEAARFVDRHPNQRFILDHAAKPRIASAELQPWSSRIHELARRENVSCKLSGLVTEAVWLTWTPQSLRPYLDTCVEAFAPHRLLAGSDWPVCLLASTYPKWWSILDQYFESFSQHEVQAIFGGNAVESYGLARQSNASTRISS
jgi:L-fuconolactonase